MIKIKYILLFLLLVELVHGQNNSNDKLINYLKSNWTSPEDYVINKFKNHDYVFIGEYHRVKHDIDLILKLIPELYKNGIYNLAIEFGSYKYQNMVDSLLNLPHFDRSLANLIMFKTYPVWGYKEYIDIYKIAWEINHTQHTDTTKFRVINIGCQYNPCSQNKFDGNENPDLYMAKVILKEIVSKKQKALIYSGNHHAFTKYHQPVYDFKKDSLIRFATKRMGNVLYDSLKEKTFNIYLHAGWDSNKNFDEPCVLPVNGTIDSIMTFFNDKRVGFDVANTPFGKLTSTNSYYALGYKNFTLDKYCDGYIYQNQFKDYKPITMENDFITKSNIAELKEFLKCIGWSKSMLMALKVRNANKKLFEDIRHHFKHLHEK